MPRQKRTDEAGVIYHALNRGNDRKKIFRKDEDYEAFIRILHEGLERYPIELFAFTLIPNHWNIVLRPVGRPRKKRAGASVTDSHENPPRLPFSLRQPFIPVPRAG